MQPLSNEQKWIQRAKDGDKEAIGILYDHYVQSIYQYISYRVDLDITAEDLTSEVFLRMVMKLPDFKYTGAPFGAWLYRLASNLIADHYRRNDRTNHVTIDDQMMSQNEDLLEQVSAGEEKAILRTALRTLSDDYQNILILRFMQGLSHADVADMLGKSVAAARVLQHRALKALENALGEDILELRRTEVDE